MVVATAAAFVFGAIIGSFLTVVAERVPERRSIVSPGSACPSCGEPVGWRHNIPIASWVLLGGKCAGCGTSISIRYPMLEAGTGLVFAAMVAVRGVTPELALSLPLAAVLVVVAVVDIERRLVPNPIVLVAALAALPLGVAADPSHVPAQLIAGAAAFGVFLLVALVAPGGMGMGDVKLAGVMGLYLGLPVVPALMIAFLTGSVAGLGVIARHGRGARKRALPFAPFLALGGVAALLAGQALIDAYTDHLL